MQHGVIKRKFGLKRDKRQDTNPKYVFSVPRQALPPVIDLRPKMPPVYDQGELGSCSANALGCAFEYAQMTNKSVSKAAAFMPSRLFVYYNERAMEGSIHEDAGAALEDGVIALKDKGVCPETMWPYDIKQFAKCPPSTAYAAATRNQLLTFKTIQQNLIQLKTALSQGYPVVFGFQVHESFTGQTVARTGVLQMPQKWEESMGGHAVCLVGYDDSRQCFIVRNSWGPSWGIGGYFYMPYNYVTDPKLASSFWVLLTVE